MSYENPTPLRVGMTGALDGWRGRIAGRVVMGVDYEGERYYWNEFNLVDGFGRSSTLVFEETEEGPEWKFFREFTPSQPFTAQEAAQKKVGDSVTLDGTSRRVTLVDESRVYHIEGTAPEGVEVGDVARYFNVDTGDRMLVVSWTGNEVEFYQGVDIPAERVRRGFGLATGAPSRVSQLSAPPDTSVLRQMRPMLVIGALVLIASAAIFFGLRNSQRGGGLRSFGSVVRKADPLIQHFREGQQLNLSGVNYAVSGHSLARVGCLRMRHNRFEYQLSGETGRTLLINGLNGGSHEWHLFSATDVSERFTPWGAAELKAGMRVPYTETAYTVVSLFKSEAREQAGNKEISKAFFGFLAENSGELLLVRWTENSIEAFKGSSIPETEVLVRSRLRGE